mgnify:CR=1 FL=1
MHHVSAGKNGDGGIVASVIEKKMEEMLEVPGGTNVLQDIISVDIEICRLLPKGIIKKLFTDVGQVVFRSLIGDT